MTTAERLTRELREAKAPAWMVERAARGYYEDFASPVAMPIHALVNDARGVGLYAIADRAIAGDFDASPAEANLAATEGREILREIF